MEESKQTENGPIPKTDDLLGSTARTCALCGCSTPAVKCDRCSSQTFCLSCDDMYHRHPKRRLHLRKAVDSIWSSSRSPRLRRRTELPGDPSKIPIPPPRSKKRDRHERHTIAGRMFLRPGLELGSFGHKLFDAKNATQSKDVYAKPKLSPNTAEGTYENEPTLPDSSSPNVFKSEELYENDSVSRNLDKHMEVSPGIEERPWNSPQPTLSPIQVSIPSSTPDLIGQSLGYSQKSQSRSITDLHNAGVSPGGQHPYHFPHPYPFMHPPVHPHYSQSMAHLNCSQCISASWSNLMSPHASPYFHPMPWGPPHAGMPQNGASHGTSKHTHGELGTYPDPSFHYPYPGGAFFPNSFPVADPNNVKELPQQVSGSVKVRRSSSTSRSPRQAQSTEDLPAHNNQPPEPTTNGSNGVHRKKSIDKAKPADVDEETKPPVPSSEPWSCLHCTFINPAGIYICQVCCKTSYGNKPSEKEEIRIDSPNMDNRNSESPMELVNMDAEISSKYSKLNAQKVI